MNKTRSTRNQPFCWQEKKILRLLRCHYDGAELQKLRNLYLTLTEIYSDFNGRNVKYYTETIAKYSGLSKEWIPKGLKIFVKLQMILLIEEREAGKFKGKKLVFTPENIKEISAFPVEVKTIPDKSSSRFIDTSEDIYSLEDNKRQEDINNTHTGEKEEKVIEEAEYKKETLVDVPVVIQQILKKYNELELPAFDYKPEDYIILETYRELGISKLFEALTLMSQSEFVRNNLSINAIFKIENLKKALNGNFKNKKRNSKENETKKKFEKPVYEDFTGDFIDEILKGTVGGN